MKKVICLFVCTLAALGLAAVSTDGQTASKNNKKPVVKKVDPLIREAEKAWPLFWGSFRKAVLTHDHASLRNVMSENFGCGFGDEIKDQRDACLKDWEKSADSNQTNDDWNHLKNIVMSGKDVGKIRKERNFEDGTFEIFRSISPDGHEYGSDRILSFVFRNYIWKWTNLHVVYD